MPGTVSATGRCYKYRDPVSLGAVVFNLLGLLDHFENQKKATHLEKSLHTISEGSPISETYLGEAPLLHENLDLAESCQD